MSHPFLLLVCMSDWCNMPNKFLVNCWPTANGNSSDVNIDFELQDTSLELHDVKISIPLPSNSGPPKVKSADGSYQFDRFDLGHLLDVSDS